MVNELRLRLLSYHSYLFWTQTFETHKSPYAVFWKQHDYHGYMRLVDGSCPFCDDFKAFYPIEEGSTETFCGFRIIQVHCLCESLRILSEDGSKAWESFRDPDAALEQIIPIDVPRGAKEETLRNVATALYWLTKPIKWMLLTGGTGTAKSHILFALRNVVGGFGFYITASDLVQSLNDAVKTGDVSQMVHDLIHAPFLFIDDYGMEHQSKGNYGVNIMTHILDQRYLLRGRAPVVMATNLSLEELQKSPVTNVARAGSRMMDSSMSQVLMFSQADFRLKTTKDEARLK